MDLSVLSDVLEHPGPYAAAYIDVSRDTEDADKRIELRSRAAFDELTGQGCPEPLAQRVADRLQGPTGAPGRASRLVVGVDAGIVLDDVVLRAAGNETVTWGPLPDVTSWVADRDALPGPVLLVLTDREGADLTLYRDWPGSLVDVTHVHGETLHITKVPGGDWAQARYQRRAEDVWRRNAEDVAAQIDTLAQRGVTWVALAGDVRAVGEVRAAVATAVQPLLVHLGHGGRSPDGSEQAVEDALDTAALDVVARRRAAVAEELAEQARHGGTALGLGPVLDALVQGRARTVVVEPSALAEHQVRLRDHPGIPAPAGADRAAPLRADHLVLSQAARTDADAVVPTDPEIASPDGASVLRDGVAAILRWSDAD